MYCAPRSRILPLLAGAGTVFALWVLSPPVEAQSGTNKGDCEMAPAAKSPTKTEKGADSGSKNMGSTGWSGGGMGVSHNETTQSGPLPGSDSKQPETVQGLDPSKQPANKRAPC